MVFDRLIEQIHGSEICKHPVNSDIDKYFKDYQDDFEAPRAVPDIEE